VNDGLDLVWSRAELPDHVFTAAELAEWRTVERDAVLELGILRRTNDATALTCDNCGPPHTVEVLRDRNRPEQPYYICPEIGRIRISSADLHRWEADFDQIATLVRRTASLTSKPATLVPSRIWLLGRQQTGDRYWELFLMCGLCWPDGTQLLNQCSRVQQSPAPVVLVPHRLPSIGAAAPLWPIRTLAEVASLSDSKLVLDVPTLAAAVGVFGSPASSIRSLRPRMSRSLGTPESVEAVTIYLETTEMTDTQFANQSNTTDRTVRNFRKTGKMRRKNFDDMAKGMGLTTEQLQGGELPHSMKQPARR
jgi:hypothetical protein